MPAANRQLHAGNNHPALYGKLIKAYLNLF